MTIMAATTTIIIIIITIIKRDGRVQYTCKRDSYVFILMF